MHLLLIGLSHRVADVELREKAALDQSQVASLLESLASRPEVKGSFVLSTCGRTEVYLTGPHLSALAAAAHRALEGVHPAGYPQYAPSLYVRVDRDSAEHLFTVATGLDSLLVGESEILGQVRAALRLARTKGTLDSVLGTTVDRAIAAARRARRESGLGRRPPSISAVAADHLSRAGLDLAHATALVIGTGEVGDAVAGQLAGRVAELVVISRTEAAAAALAGRHGARAATLGSLASQLERADLAVFAAAASRPLLNAEQVPPRSSRPLAILDLGMPRNVQPAVGKVGGVSLVGVDELSAEAEAAARGQDAVRSAASAVLGQELETWSKWFGMEGLGPTLAELARYAEGIRAAELNRALRGLDLEPRARRRVETLSRALVSKLLIHPIGYLRSNPEDAEALALIEKIFSAAPDKTWS